MGAIHLSCIHMGDDAYTVLDFKERVITALGSASLCWDPHPTGVFDSAAVEQIYEMLAKDIDIDAVCVKGSHELADKLIWVLQEHCGERGSSEGAVETLKRIIAERDACLKMLFGQYEVPWKQMMERYG